jgi:hypothetical protein
LIKATLAIARKFAAPLAIEVLAPNKFLFAVSLQSHVDRILLQGPWNIKGSLLLLQPWTPGLTINEVSPHLCPFQIQIHGLPLQNMTSRNAVTIGKGLGNLLEVNNLDSLGSICRQHLRIKVEINTLIPLVPGFLFPRYGKESIWTSFKYARLAHYCTFCGLIGHKKYGCPNPPQPLPREKYSFSLRATTISGPSWIMVPPAISSEAPTSCQTKAPLEVFHGDESRGLQLVPCSTPLQHSLYVPMDQVEDILCSNTKLLDSSHVTLQSIPLWMDASSFDTSSTASDNILPSPSPSYQDNGKSTLISTPSVFSTDPYPVIIATEYPPPIMDTTLKPIQEMSKPTPSTLIQEFSEPKPSTHLGLNILPPQPSQITLSPLAFPSIRLSPYTHTRVYYLSPTHILSPESTAHLQT